MSFDKSAYEHDKQKLRDALMYKSEIKCREEYPKPTISAYNWVSKYLGIGQRSWLQYSKKAIAKYGSLTIKDYVLFQVTDKDACNTLTHRWDGQALERIVARWYSDNPMHCGPIWRADHNDRHMKSLSAEPGVDEKNHLIGFFNNLRCVDKVSSPTNESGAVKNCVLCDIVLYQAIDTPFFNAASFGETDCGDHYVDPETCILSYLTNSIDSGTPCYISASIGNLQNTVEEQQKEINELKEDLRLKDVVNKHRDGKNRQTRYDPEDVDDCFVTEKACCECDCEEDYYEDGYEDRIE